ncbi:MAG TPA: 1-deoxy-D-xylulose-5-phosphate reductoisomerase [bacterium]|nr:1-deoxy-D-xylulose-5-phosphate reductoisomerase [bacterium]
MAERVTRRLAILGSTGSVGCTALDVVRHLKGRPGEVQVVALAGHANIPRLCEQVREHRPAAVAVGTAEGAARLRTGTSGWRGEILVGSQGLATLAAEAGADLVLVAVAGAAGLAPTVAALSGGTDVALATKEALVAGGALVTAAAQRTRARLLPVDSEHSAIFQCLDGRARHDVARLWLTASGGPFLRLPADALDTVGPAEALRHPTWAMGPKVTIDSATLMNKGLEVIEAHWLFGIAPEAIEVVVHPQSIVHSLVEFVDGSLLGQLGPTDMRVPVQYALTYPERHPSPVMRLDIRTMTALSFEAPDLVRFPCLALAREALQRGGTAPAVLNAANEVAVRLFLEQRIGFPDIARLVRRVLDSHRLVPASSLDAVLGADREAREAAEAAAQVA